MLDKKGAIEMSMTTIIVIVLGVTLLILGLTFVRSIFTNLQTISKNTFEGAQDMLKGIEDVNQFLTITPGDISIEKGGDGAVKVILANLGEDPIEVSAEVKTTFPNLKCQFLTEAGSYETRAGPYKINSGSQKKLVLVVKDDGKGTLGVKGCSITITGTGIQDEDTSGGVVVKIISAQKV